MHCCTSLFMRPYRLGACSWRPSRRGCMYSGNRRATAACTAGAARKHGWAEARAGLPAVCLLPGTAHASAVQDSGEAGWAGWAPAPQPWPQLASPLASPHAHLQVQQVVGGTAEGGHKSVQELAQWVCVPLAMQGRPAPRNDLRAAAGWGPVRLGAPASPGSCAARWPASGHPCSQGLGASARHSQACPIQPLPCCAHTPAGRWLVPGCCGTTDCHVTIPAAAMQLSNRGGATPP